MTTATATTTNEDGLDSELGGIMSAFPRRPGGGLPWHPLSEVAPQNGPYPPLMEHQSKDCTPAEDGQEQARPVLRKKKCFYDLRDAFHQQQPASHRDKNPSEHPRQSDS
ncbi:hypothetical protein SCLCIDRAFT_32625 [Scleroderma citrinum Foug A]|uniref:Uncharacterized protein n=1 Tax=Scleroderma citrinum Foug A TaxID=1036808 RepID=A0A0C3CV57_9AGAM|nr:hypothetical protein SCLCIDRAFT_32625 [Scleroderma citrinum Foug A]